MFTNFGIDNYLPGEGLVVTYDQTHVLRYLVKVVRTATKSYSFIDMTSGAARACELAKTRQYTRSFDDDEYNSREGHVDQQTKIELRTEIRRVRTPCGSFDVTIDVHETDTRMIAPETAGEFVSDALIAEVFADHDRRDYDEALNPEATDGLDAASAKCCRITSDLRIVYTASLRKLKDGREYWNYHRSATKEYVFFGLSFAAMRACVVSRQALYCRDVWRINSGLANVSDFDHVERKNVAAILPRHERDGRWSVTLTVNEEDIKARAESLDPEEVFADCESRDYDDLGVLKLLSVDRADDGKAIANYTETFRKFDEEELEFEYRPVGYPIWSPGWYPGSYWEDGFEARLVYRGEFSNVIKVEGRGND